MVLGSSDRTAVHAGSLRVLVVVRLVSFSSGSFRFVLLGGPSRLVQNSSVLFTFVSSVYLCFVWIRLLYFSTTSFTRRLVRLGS